ncbi:four-jointed box protein 1 [Electrophorus electricus]|uniref:Four-jointed box kinase 1 n=1 Tax=Electrophorus electricus TaxID=8005 RepID=A0A4W4FEJ9_ELEEL|nr:four-jointed box protein 1 [Electrophorus electricus]
MRAIWANLLALLFLCTCACVLYFWSRLEKRLERHKRDFQEQGPYLGPSSDLSAKTFRALLAVPAAEKLYFASRIHIHNVTGAETVSTGNGNNVLVKVNHLKSIDPEVRRGPDITEAVEDGIFWSQNLEDRLSVGFSEKHARSWRRRARGSRVVSLEAGCGRTSNQLATFSDGTKACVRYGINADQVQGETLSYYLGCLLGITNIPPLVLAQLNVDGERWASVRSRIASLQWSRGEVVSLTEWIANLTGVVTPAPLRQDSERLHPLLEDLRRKTKAELLALMQWSDLLIFDYLTANFDRLASNLFSLQWDPRVMERDTSNLLQTPRGALVFIDNEAGLVHGYRVLDMWERHHSAILRSVCLFRRRTAQRVIDLHLDRDARTRLLELYRDNEPLAAHLGFLSDEHARILQDRIERVYKHILHCKGKYSQ